MCTSLVKEDLGLISRKAWLRFAVNHQMGPIGSICLAQIHLLNPEKRHVKQTQESSGIAPNGTYDFCSILL